MSASSKSANRSRSSATAGAEPASKRHLILASALLQIYFVCNLLSFAIWEVSGVAALHMMVYFGVWIAGSIAVLSAYLRLASGGKRSLTTVAVLTVVAMPMFGVWIQSLELQSRWPEWALLLSFPAFIYFYFRLGTRSFKKLSIVVLGLCVLSLFSHVNLFKLVFTSAKEAPAIEKHAASDEKHSMFELKHRPNVHMVMFDSLSTSKFTKEFIGIDNPASDYLSEMENTLFAGNRGFVEEVPTKKSWNFVFNLGTRSYEKGDYLFSGIHRSPLSELLNRNGYSIQTGYSSKYLGHTKGEHIDHYYVGTSRWPTVRAPFCEQKLLGYCGDRSGKIYEFLASLFSGSNPFEYGSISWENRVVELIREFEDKSKSPIFSAFHVYFPGHVPNGVVLNEKSIQAYGEELEALDPRIVEALQEIDVLRQEFPESMFIISGDHGPWIGSQLNYEQDRRFFVLGRHHVALALINANNLCDYERAWLREREFLSPARMLAASLSCDGEPEALLDGFTENSEFVEFGATLGSRAKH